MKFSNKEISTDELDRLLSTKKKELEKANAARREISAFQDKLIDVTLELDKYKVHCRRKYAEVRETAEKLEIPAPWKDFWVGAETKADDYWFDSLEAANGLIDRYIDTLSDCVLEAATWKWEIKEAERSLCSAISTPDRQKANERILYSKDKFKEKMEFKEMKSYPLFTDPEHIRNYFHTAIALFVARDLTDSQKSFFGERYGETISNLLECDFATVGGTDKVFEDISTWSGMVVTQENIERTAFNEELILLRVYDGDSTFLDII